MLESLEHKKGRDTICKVAMEVLNTAVYETMDDIDRMSRMHRIMRDELNMSPDETYALTREMEEKKDRLNILLYLQDKVRDCVCI